MPSSPALTKIEEILVPAIEALGYRFVQLRLMESGKSRTLQLMAERQDNETMNVDDCATISRSVSALLDVKEPIQGAYNLEVSSPGIDRPLVNPQDFISHIGYEIKIETMLPIDGRKRFKGTLVTADDTKAIVQLEKETANVPYNIINHAKLVLTDALIREHLNNAKKAKKQPNA